MRNFIVVLFVIIAIVVVPFTLAARTGDHTAGSWTDWQELGALANCNDASINSAVICGNVYGIKAEGYNALTLEIRYTKSAGTGWEYDLETCYEGHGTADCTDAADWHKVAVDKVVSGVVTLTEGKFTHAASASDGLTYSIPINYRRLRLNNFVATGTPDANDKVKVNARLGWLPSF